MKKIGLSILSIVFSLFATGQSVSERVRDAIWQEFRKNFPNPYQTIGFAHFEDDNSQLYIIAEPAPHVTLDDIREIFDGFDYSVDVKSWKIGYDGWIKDVLVTVNFIPEICKDILITDLNNLVFSSTYKPVYMKLPCKNPRQLFLDDDIDYRISDVSLKNWFVDNNMTFLDLENERSKYSFNEVLNGKYYGILMSEIPNFVVWSIPQNGDISHRKEDIRRFALDADIILGAISNSRTLIIIGRERQSTFEALPPLRTETIEMLARTNDKYMSQSLNIAELITGKMDNGADWCPAYLSDELENDEFGHLLTMTDIFLKDWLSDGMLSYPEYHYKKPYRYYEIDRDNASSIRYNWNTNDYIYSTDFGNCKVISLRNTACLNASLFNSSEIEETGLSKQINDGANSYLASLNNIDLARVAQYTVLYQIFKANNISCSLYKTPYTKEKSTLLLADTRNILSKLRNLSNSEITTIAHRIANDHYNQYLYQDLQLLKETKREAWEKELEKAARAAAQKRGLSYDEFVKSSEYKTKRDENLKRFEAQLQIWFNQSKEQTISEKEKKMYDGIIALKNKLAGVDYSDFEMLCKYVAYPNGNYSSDYRRIRHLSHEITNLYWTVWLYAKYFNISMETVKNKYVTALQNDNSRWLKTPKIVVTDNQKGRIRVGENTYITVGGCIGGHSIPATVPAKPADYSARPQDREKIMGTSKFTWVNNKAPEVKINEQPGNSTIEKAANYATAGARVAGKDPIAAYEYARISSDYMPSGNIGKPDKSQLESIANVLKDKAQRVQITTRTKKIVGEQKYLQALETIVKKEIETKPLTPEQKEKLSKVETSIEAAFKAIPKMLNNPEQATAQPKTTTNAPPQKLAKEEETRKEEIRDLSDLIRIRNELIREVKEITNRNIATELGIEDSGKQSNNNVKR
jgi:hypothetical protein